MGAPGVRQSPHDAATECSSEDVSTKEEEKEGKAEAETGEEGEVEEEYAVQEIVGHRRGGPHTQDGITMFYVRWAGYAVADNTWQSRHDLANATGTTLNHRRAGMRGGL